MAVKVRRSVIFLLNPGGLAEPLDTIGGTPVEKHCSTVGPLNSTVGPLAY